MRRLVPSRSVRRGMQPCKCEKPNSEHAGLTIYFLEGNGCFNQQFEGQGSCVVLMGDFNESLYSGRRTDLASFGNDMRLGRSDADDLS